MKRLALAAAALALPLALTSSAQTGACPLTGITTTDVGVGTGLLQPTIMGLGFDSTLCELMMKFDAPTCCNVFVTQHWFGLGTNLVPGGIPLGPPFYPGSLLYLGAPLSIFGPSPGLTSSIAVPASPGLVGATFPVQAVLEFFTTIGFTYDYGMSQAMLLTFN